MRALEHLPLLVSIACGVVACGGPVRSGELAALSRSTAVTPPAKSLDTVPLRDAEPATLAEAPRPPDFERMGPCTVRVTARQFRDVPDVALVAAALPLGRAHPDYPAALEVPNDGEPVWKDCHGRPSLLGGHPRPTLVTARVGTRLVVDEQHGYAWIGVGSVEGILARFRLDGDKLTASATSPDLDPGHVVVLAGLRSARVGGAEIVFRPLDLTSVDLDLKPAEPVRAEGWNAFVSRGEADFSGDGRILTRYRDARRMMVVAKTWGVSDQGLAVEETWWPEKTGRSVELIRRYVLRGDELVPLSKKVPR